jgi:hypothetical protein
VRRKNDPEQPEGNIGNHGTPESKMYVVVSESKNQDIPQPTLNDAERRVKVAHFADMTAKDDLTKLMSIDNV